MKKFDNAQQVPKRPAPEPGVPPGNIPPIPAPEIPFPDPAPPPPPLENPGDLPLPPITDPDAIEPGDPSPAYPPMRVRGVKRSRGDPDASLSAFKAGADSNNGRRNLFPSSAFHHPMMAANLADASNTDGVAGSASANDLIPQPWSAYMSSSKPEDIAADLAALRDDVAKLTSAVSEFVRTQAAATTNTVFDAVDSTRQKISDTASTAQDRVAGASRDFETTIEHNPLSAVLIAMVVGLFIGMLGGSLSRK